MAKRYQIVVVPQTTRPDGLTCYKQTLMGVFLLGLMARNLSDIMAKLEYKFTPTPDDLDALALAYGWRLIPPEVHQAGPFPLWLPPGKGRGYVLELPSMGEIIRGYDERKR